MVGSGGTGKSTTVEKILQSLPQVITHVSYKGRDFILKQLVWLKLDCPRNGSLRDLCFTFFRVVDEVLGTEYKKRYAGNSRRTLEDLIAGMARVSANHCLGIIIIDEIQDLSEARSGGDITMVNFFVHPENAIGVPFALIGTQDAVPILSTQFRQARRVSEQGYIAWDRMSEVEPEIEEDDDEDDDDEEPTTLPGVLTEQPTSSEEDEEQVSPTPDAVWKNFVETLWTYQYVKHLRKLKENVVEDKCAHALYRVSKGIPAVVQTIFVLSQQLAILSGEEKITPRLIRETVRQNQQVISEMLGEARMKKPRELRPVGDLADMDQIYEAELSPVVTQDEHDDDLDSTNSLVRSNAGEDGGDIVQPVPANVNTRPETVPDKKVPSSKGKSTGKALGGQRENLSRNDLRNPLTRSSEQIHSKSSRKNKYSRPPGEYLKRK
ncbi:MAG TPA: ATP-binding protein [Pyrinomonadaceae bacterium]